MSSATQSDWRLFNILSLVIGVLGLVSGYYFFIAAQPSVKLSYVTQRTAIAQLDRDRFSLEVDGKKLNSRSLFRTEIAVWNSGNVALEKSAIRRPLIVEFGPNSGIVFASIEKRSHNISAFRAEGQESKLQIDWDYFDPKFFVVVVLYHVADEDPQVSLRYVGDKEIVFEIPKNLSDNRYFSAATVVGSLALVPLLLAIAFPLARKVFTFFDRRPRQFFGYSIDPEFVAFCTLGVVSACLFALIFYLIATGKATNLVRVALDLDVPAELREIFSIDQGANKAAR